MKRLLLLFVLLFYSFSYGKSNDEIDFSLFTEQAETFVTVMNQGNKMVRWQSYTAHPLTIYQMPSHPVIAVYENPVSKTLIGLSEEELLIWKINSPEIVKRFAIKDFVPNFKKSDSGTIYLLKRNQSFLSDYIPEQDLMAIVSGNSLYVINTANRELLFEKELDNELGYPKFLSDGNILVTEKNLLEETLLAVNFQTDRTRRLYTAGKMITAVNNERTRYSIFSDNRLVSYNLQHQETNQVRLQDQSFFLESSMSYTSFGFVVLPYWGSIKLLSTTDDSSINSYYGKDFDNRSLSIKKDLLLLHNSSTIFISNLTGEILFEAELSNVDALYENNRLKNEDLAGFTKTEQYKITSVTSTETGHYATDNTGMLYFYDKNKNPTDSIPVLGNAITHFNLIDNQTAFIAGYGRGSLFNLKNKEHIRVLNGHTSNITSSLVLSDVFLLTTGQDKKTVLWDMQKGVYMADFNSDRMPLSLSKKANNHILINYTDGSSQEWDLSNHITQYLNPPREMLLSTTHSKNIIDLAFLPERDLMLSTDSQGYVKIWDIRTMVPVFTIKPGGENRIHAIFNKELNEVLAYSLNKIYHIDIVSGKIKKEVDIPLFYSDNLALHNLSVYPNAPLVVINNNKNNNQLTYHPGSGLFYYFLATKDQYAPFGIAVDETNDRIAFFGKESVDIWSVKDLQNPIKQIKNTNKSSDNMYVRRLVNFSPLGTKIMYERDQKLVVYDLFADKEIYVADNVLTGTFTNEDQIVYCFKEDIYSDQTQVVKYDLNTKQNIFSFDIEGSIMKIEYDSAKNILALGLSGGDVEFLDADKGVNIKRISIKSKSPKTKYNLANGYITTTIPGATLIFDWKHLKLDTTIDYTTWQGTFTPNYTFSPDGKYFVQSYSNKVEFYDAKSFKFLFDFPLVNNEGFLTDMKISDDNKYIVFSNILDGVFVYDIQTKSLLYKIEDDYNNLLKDVHILSDDSGTYLWAMIQKQKSEKEKSEEKNKAGIPKNTNTYLNIYNLNTKRIESENLLGDSNYFSNFSFTKNKKYIFFESEWKEITVLDIENKKTTRHKVNIDNSINSLYPSADESNIIITDDLGYLHFMNINSGEIIGSIKASNSKISDVLFFEDDAQNYMITCSEEGFSKIWNYDNKELLVSLLAFSKSDYMFINADNYYSGTRAIVDAVHFKYKGKIYGFEQFDLYYNRPDIVLKTLNNDLEIQQVYLSAYQKRLKNLGYNPDSFNPDNINLSVPDISIERNTIDFQTRDKNFNFLVKASDRDVPIKKLHVWINGVPIYGVNGFDLKGSAKSVKQTVDLELSSGLNAIKVSVVNQKGVESLKESFNVTYVNEAPETKAYYIGIGISNYKDAQYNLTYSTKDINDLGDLFSGRYDNYISYKLLDSLATKTNILALKEVLSKTNVDDLVIISFSGHGILDDNYNWYYATYNMNFDNPSVSGLSYEEIESLLDGIPARKKILLIDACHSGEVDKEYMAEISKTTNSVEIASIPVGGKGAHPVNVKPKVGMENSFDLMKELFANLSKSNGSVIVSAAGGMEYAFEGNDWKNGVFTYCFINGLEHLFADQNKNGKITISEIKNYVSQQVEVITKGKQKPTSRQENVENDFEL